MPIPQKRIDSYEKDNSLSDDSLFLSVRDNKTYNVTGKSFIEYIKNKLFSMFESKVDKVSGKGLSTNDYTTTEKNKLAGIAEGANKYVHPGSGTNPHGTTKTDVGLGNVGNFKAVSTVASQGLTDTEKSNARTNIGAQAAGNYASSSHKHSNADITSLDASKITSGIIDIARLPQGALDRLITVADDTARFKLTTNDVQLGDTVKVVSPVETMYYVIDESKLNSEAGYSVYTAGTATSVPWNGITDKPNSYTPSSHNHDDRYYTETEINTKLDGKVDLSASGVSKAINQLTTGSSTPSDADYYVSQYVGGGTTTVTYHRRPMSALWSYIKGKADNVYSALGHKHTKADIGLDNVGNFKAVSTVANQGLTDVEKANARANIGAGASGFSGDYNDLINAPTSLPANGGNSATVNGHSVNSDVPVNAKFTDTWRGIQNNLTSNSATDSLSAVQGKVLKGLVDNAILFQSTEPTTQSINNQWLQEY